MTPEQEKGILQAFDSYCKTVLRNKARNLHKEASRLSRYEIPMDDLPPEAKEDFLYWDVYDFSQPVPVGLHDREMRVSDPVLAAALIHCLPRFREVLFLSYFLEYSDKEISELLEIPVSTVTSRRKATLEKLKELLGENHAV